MQDGTRRATKEDRLQYLYLNQRAPIVGGEKKIQLQVQDSLAT
jgi:hypothetical protein